jgi:DNA-3-methyladenine glycosylase II
VTTRSFTIVPEGDFSLRESDMFGFGQRMPAGQRSRTQRRQHDFDGVMRLAFCADGYRNHAGVELRQDADGVHAVVHGDADLDPVQAQVARVLSLDYDGRQFTEVGRRDPVIGRLQQAAPGLRPPLFYSPYEAAAWSVLSARRPIAQMAQVRAALSRQYGTVFQLAGQELAALPTPEQLLRMDEFPGLNAEKVQRLHGVARAALDGELDASRLKALGPEQAMVDVQRIKGIGPMYSSLIVIRATGFADVLPTGEPIALDLIQQLYDLPAPPTPDALEALAEPWRPFRTWAVVLIRAAASRVLTP